LDFILRNAFGVGLIWASTTLRHLTLVLAFVGAAVATDRNQHLAVDLLSEKIPPAIKANYVMRLINGVVAVLCLALGRGALQSMQSAFSQWAGNSVELASGSTGQAGSIWHALSIDWAAGGLPLWVSLFIIACGFLMLGAHFIVASILGRSAGTPSKIVNGGVQL